MIQPLFVTNARPGFYRPAYRPAPYAPSWRPSPGLASPKRLGQTEDIGVSLAIGAVGVGGFFLSSLLPTPWDLVAKATSVVVVGYSFYRVLAGKTTSGATSETGAKVGPVTTISNKEDFDSITAAFTTPKTYSTLPYGFFSGKYPVEVLVSYPLAESETDRLVQKPVTFTVLLEAIEEPFYYVGTKGDKQSGIVGSQSLTLAPGGQVPIQFNPALISSTFLQPALNVTLNVYKVRSGTTGERTKMATVTFFMK